MGNNFFNLMVKLYYYVKYKFDVIKEGFKKGMANI
jgi:hypothetical protein